MLALILAGCTSCRKSPTVFETLTSDAFNVFVIHYPRGQEGMAQDVLHVLDENLHRIEGDLRPDKTGGFTVWVYPNLKEFHQAIGMPDAPDWVVGVSPGEGVLGIVSPSNPGPSHDYQGMLKVAVHELTHCVTRRLAGSVAVKAWLGEGIALYEAGQFRDPKQVLSLASGEYPEFLSAADPTQATEIYQLGFTAIEYIVNTWGMESVRELILRGGDIGVVLGLTEDQFYEGWFAFVKARYLD